MTREKMNLLFPQKLDALEKRHDIRVLLAVESGSLGLPLGAGAKVPAAGALFPARGGGAAGQPGPRRGASAIESISPGEASILSPSPRKREDR